MILLLLDLIDDSSQISDEKETHRKLHENKTSCVSSIKCKF